MFATNLFSNTTTDAELAASDSRINYLNTGDFVTIAETASPYELSVTYWPKTNKCITMWINPEGDLASYESTLEEVTPRNQALLKEWL